MEDNVSDFCLCRVCLLPTSVSNTLVKIVSLFDGNGENAEKVKFISGIDVR